MRLQKLIPFHLLFSTYLQYFLSSVQSTNNLTTLIKPIIRFEFSEGWKRFHWLKVSSLLIFHSSYWNQFWNQVYILLFKVHRLVLIDLFLYLCHDFYQGLLKVIDICIVVLFEILLKTYLLVSFFESWCWSDTKIYLLYSESSIISIPGDNSGSPIEHL